MSKLSVLLLLYITQIEINKCTIPVRRLMLFLWVDWIIIIIILWIYVSDESGRNALLMFYTIRDILLR